MGAPDRLWVPHPEQVFVPGQLVGRGDKETTFVDLEGTEVRHPTAKVAQLDVVFDSQLAGVDNVCDLETVSEASVLHTVRTRFFRPASHIYTRVSRIMIAVNPFKMLPIYSTELMRQYIACRDSMDLPPHIFAVGQDAIMGLKSGRNASQAVLVSGESGAGKTESTKLVLSHIAAASGGGRGGGLEDKIMQINPILESFGNAMTARNNNSSRFGKWVEIALGGGDALQGCSVTDYLLELTRVCSQGKSERNYHIFFQMIEAKAQLSELEVGDASSYRYTKDCAAKAPGIDDRAFFEELREAFTGIGFSEAQQQDIFKIVVGILSLGNADFADAADDCCQLSNRAASVDPAARRLGVGTSELEKALVTRRIKVGRDVTESGRKASQAVLARDALARLLYGRLFKVLIAKINAQLSSGKAASAHKSAASGIFFGILDIAGFESFETNSLEQLSINLSNEHLQSHFNDYVFTHELADYKAEGIGVGDIKFQDNSDIIALIDSKCSILAVLDEEVSVPKATDISFCNKAVRAFESHFRFVKPKGANSSYFGIKHFAGTVTYTVTGFLEKNVDKPPDEAPDLFKASSNSFVKEIGAELERELAEAGGGGGGRKKMKTVSSGFRASLASLMKKLREAEPHFIRCIKPNSAKVPDKFVSAEVMDQLTCSGVFEAVRIRRCGFASRLLFSEFASRYAIMLPKDKRKELKSKKDGQEQAKTLAGALPRAVEAAGGEFVDGDLQLGKTKVFLRARLATTLDRARDLGRSSYAVLIQKVWRGYNCRRRQKERLGLKKDMSAWRTKNDFYGKPGGTAFSELQTAEKIMAQYSELLELLAKVDEHPECNFGAQDLRQIGHRMQAEADALSSLRACTTSIEPVAIEKALLRAKDLGLPQDSQAKALEERLHKLKAQLPLLKAVAKCAGGEGVDDEDVLLVYSEAEKLGLHEKAGAWIAELQVSEHLPKLRAAAGAARARQPPKAPVPPAAAKARAKASPSAPSSAAAGAEGSAAPNGRGGEGGAAGGAAAGGVTNAKGQADAGKAKAGGAASAAANRMTITGLTAGDQVRILLEMREAAEVFDAEGLELMLATAIEEGIDESDKTYEQARGVFELLESKETVSALLKETAEEASVARRGGSKKLRKLQNLLAQASRLGLEGPEVDEAKETMQRVARKRARSTIKGRMFDEINMQEVDLADRAFADLSTFKRLRPASVWRGQASSRRFAFAFARKEAKQDIMLSHSQSEIKSSLTKLGFLQDKRACDLFIDILSWMGDRPVPEVQRVMMAALIIEAAAPDQAITDEVFVQLMKQLTNNPSGRSVRRGWELMLMLCQNVTPSGELFEYLQAFFIRAMRAGDPEVSDVVRQCIADLNFTNSSDHSDEAGAEVIAVVLADFTMRKVRAPPSATLRTIADRVAEQLRISRPADFALFMLTDIKVQAGAPRLLPEHATISVILQKLATVKERTGKNAALMFRRVLLQDKEALLLGDQSHARLTYHQALHDYLQYPIVEDEGKLLRIAAAVLWCDRDSFGPYLKAGELASHGVLEQLLPESFMRGARRQEVASKVTKCYLGLERELDQEESSLLAMSRAFAEMQKLRLCGSYMWQCQEMTYLPEGVEQAVDHPTTLVCQIHPKLVEGKFTIGVSGKGVAFVCLDDGGLFYREFAFSEEAYDRILDSGVSRDFCQLVVSCVAPSRPEEGNVPQLITLHCPAAVDIAYLCHRISTAIQEKQI